MILLFILLITYNFTPCKQITYEERVAPLVLHSFWSNSDISYFQVNVPKRTISTKLTAIIPSLDCALGNITLHLKHNSLPVVQPLDAGMPRGVISYQSYVVELPIFKSFSVTKSIQKYGQLSILYGESVKADSATTIKLEIISPEIGVWYFGTYFTSPSLERCTVAMVPLVKHDVFHHSGYISISNNEVTAENAEIHVSSSNVIKTTITSVKDSIHSSKIPNIDSPLHLDGQPKTNENNSKKRRKLFRTDVFSNHGSPQVMSEPTLLTSPLTLELSPLEQRLYTLNVVDEMTGIMIKSNNCVLIAQTNFPTLMDSKSATAPTDHFRDSNNCPLFFDASVGSVPLGLSTYSSRIHKSEGQLRYTTVTDVNNQLHFFGIRGSNAEHYLYIRNQASDVAIKFDLSIASHFDCDILSRVGTFHFSRGTVRQDKEVKITNSTGVNISNSAAYLIDNTQKFSRGFSFLPWIESSWPELTPEYGEKKWLKLRKSQNRTKISSIFVSSNMGRFELEHPAYQVIPQCFIWPKPGRIQSYTKFTYLFTYQPSVGRSTILLHLQPWHITSIPVDIDPGPGVGGALEVALQLNALNASWQSKSNDMKPLSRQVILHGCFAQHVTNTPIMFTNPHYCQLWLRLATNYGDAVSVAHATWSAISEGLTSSQPPSRSERLPSFDLSYREGIDRNFFHILYPSPGRWYLNLYAECYTTFSVFCGMNEATSIDVSVVLRSTPCVNFRCRHIGEGSTLTPSRLLHSHKNNLLKSTTKKSFRWRPPWWSKTTAFNTVSSHSNYKSPLKISTSDLNSPDDQALTYEGICVHLAHSIVSDASSCACPLGFGGIGCMPLRQSYFSSRGFNPHSIVPSTKALILALSNFAILPAIILALFRRLWIPATIYTYTMVFSTLYHLCDTDRQYFPTGTEPISPVLKSKSNFDTRIPSNVCALPIDVLSFCDFFGGIFTVWVTAISAAALPIRFAECAYIFGMLALIVAVHVIRYSVGLFVAPLIVGAIILLSSWIRLSYKLRRLFPPIQWLAIGFVPASITATIGVVLFASILLYPEHYTALHSTWHVCMGLSLMGFLPWPTRWRVALSPFIPHHVPLSCGDINHGDSIARDACAGATYTNNSNTDVDNVRHLTEDSNSVIEPTSVGSNSKSKSFPFGLYRECKRIHGIWTDKLDELLELRAPINYVCTKWPKLKWIIPHGHSVEYHLPQDNRQHNQPISVC